ncbi:MAG: hypothetical protein IIA87_05995 [Nanoarchaeota archaeon]|nr:hypothetical protein [Nanoarchaeota archaeon]
MGESISESLVDIGMSIRRRINELSLGDRIKKESSILKGENTALPDALGESRFGRFEDNF